MLLIFEFINKIYKFTQRAFLFVKVYAAGSFAVDFDNRAAVTLSGSGINGYSIADEAENEFLILMLGNDTSVRLVDYRLGWSPALVVYNLELVEATTRCVCDITPASNSAMTEKLPPVVDLTKRRR